MPAVGQPERAMQNRVSALFRDELGCRYLFEIDEIAALREALLNAVVHKDYSSGVPIQISVYEDKLVLWNSGDLPEHWTLEELLGKHPSLPFNPLIANAFFRAGYIESWGRGIEKINRECREHGVDPPAYDFGMAGLMLTFHANPAHLQAATTQADKGGVQDTLVKTLVETRVKTPERILDILKAQPDLTLAQVAKAIGKSLSAVERAVARLAANGRLRYVGPRKGGHWEILT